MIEIAQHFIAGHVTEIVTATVVVVLAAGFRDYGRRLERRTREQSGRRFTN